MTLPPIHPVRQVNTHRLLPAKYSHDFSSVLTRIADNQEHLDTIFALDDATNDRLLAEERGIPGIDARELVFHVPESHIINAAFTHPNPLGARFSTPLRGAWYASFELATSKAEVLFHKTVEFAEIDWRGREELQYEDYRADFSASFHDLRSADPPGGLPELADCLSPTSYVASQSLAEQLLNEDSLGVVYPSVRRAGGTCLACFRPSIVSNVRKGHRYKLVWTAQRGGTWRREGSNALSSEEDSDDPPATAKPGTKTA